METGLTRLVFMLPWPWRPKWPVSLRRTVRFCLLANRSLELAPLLPRELSIGKKGMAINGGSSHKAGEGEGCVTLGKDL